MQNQHHNPYNAVVDHNQLFAAVSGQSLCMALNLGQAVVLPAVFVPQG
tara:strand:- start:242 stop:385 length:144 start_codon:yes stop_codon:yes gene_type:complete